MGAILALFQDETPEAELRKLKQVLSSQRKWLNFAKKLSKVLGVLFVFFFWSLWTHIDTNNPETVEWNGRMMIIIGVQLLLALKATDHIREKIAELQNQLGPTLAQIR